MIILKNNIYVYNRSLCSLYISFGFMYSSIISEALKKYRMWLRDSSLICLVQGPVYRHCFKIPATNSLCSHISGGLEVTLLIKTKQNKTKTDIPHL